MKYIFVSGWRGDRSRPFANHLGLTPEEESTVRHAVSNAGPGIVVHGDASGVDHAASLCFPCPFPVPAPWKTRDKGAGPQRNLVLIKLALMLRDELDHEVVVLAFPKPRISRGTYNFINKAQKMGLDVEAHELSTTSG